MTTKKRVDRKYSPTPEDASKIAAIRKRFQEDKPSLDELVESGEYLAPVTVGEYFEIAALLAKMKKMRIKSGLSLRDFAELSGIDHAAISRLENGIASNPTIHTLARYAKALNKRIHITIEDEPVNVD